MRDIKVVERVPKRIANRRSDFVNKVSRGPVDRFGVIAFEDLDIKNMLKNHNSAKPTSDVAWGVTSKRGWEQNSVRWLPSCAGGSQGYISGMLRVWNLSSERAIREDP